MTARLRSPGDDPARLRPEAPVDIVVDGRTVEALPGQTVAAALLAAGRDSWRRTRGADQPRGVFCGIGACFDCLVVVNGIPDVRACQRRLVAGDTIRTQYGAALPQRTGDDAGTATAGPAPGAAVSPAASVSPAATAGTEPAAVVPAAEAVRAEAAAIPSRTPATGVGVRETAVVVVGAGPAGMAAALAAADAGVDVLLVDAARAVGGQYHRQLPEEFHAERPDRLQHGWQAFAALRQRIGRHERITHLAETSVWAIEPLPAPARGHRLRVQTGPADAPGQQVTTVDTRTVVLATGAYDRVLPFPGWELPGVYTAGAAQALAKGQRVAVGKRVLVAGTGPFLLPVAESLLGVGAEVVGLLEANRPVGVLKGWLSDPLAASGKIREGAAYAAMLARHRIPLKHGYTVIAAHGAERVDSVTVARLDTKWRPVPGTERRVEVDAVCLGFGFTAQLELAVSARCELGDGPDGGPAALVDEHQQTSVPGVFAAGELTGIGGADLAAAEGRLAGAAAAAVLSDVAAGPGRLRQPDRRAAELAEVRRQVARGRRFAAGLAKAYPVRSGWQSWSAPDTLICRCEEVTCDHLRASVAERDVLDTRSLKLSSRVGLGLCQGRLCSRTAAELAAAYRPGVRADPAGGGRRPIAVPVRLRDLAATLEPDEPLEEL